MHRPRATLRSDRDSIQPRNIQLLGMQYALGVLDERTGGITLRYFLKCAFTVTVGRGISR